MRFKAPRLILPAASGRDNDDDQENEDHDTDNHHHLHILPPIFPLQSCGLKYKTKFNERFKLFEIKYSYSGNLELPINKKKLKVQKMEGKFSY